MRFTNERELSAFLRRQALVRRKDRDAKRTREIAAEADADRHLNGDTIHFPPGKWMPLDIRGFVGREIHSQIRW